MNASRRLLVFPWRSSASIRWVLDWYDNRLTSAGRIVVFGVVTSTILGFSSIDVPIYLIACATAALLLTGVFLSLFFRPKVDAIRRLPKHVRAGETIKYDITIINPSPQPARYLKVEEIGLPPELKTYPLNSPGFKFIPGKSETELSLSLECSKRGVYRLAPLAISSAYPSGLVKAIRRAGPEQSLMIYPNFKHLSDFPLPTSRRYQPGGLYMTSEVGDSTEFLCTREYQEGDNIRDIHWASWARTGKPVIKVFQEEFFVRLALLLDSEVRGENDQAFEAGISLAASVADVLSRQEYIIDIFAAGEKIYRFQAGRSLAHFDNILQILACITHAPRVKMNPVREALAPEAGSLSALVCILMDWDEERRNLVRSLNSLGLATRSIVVKKESPTLSIQGEPGVSWWKPDQIGKAF